MGMLTEWFGRLDQVYRKPNCTVVARIVFGCVRQVLKCIADAITTVI